MRRIASVLVCVAFTVHGYPDPENSFGELLLALNPSMSAAAPVRGARLYDASMMAKPAPRKTTVAKRAPAKKAPAKKAPARTDRGAKIRENYLQSKVRKTLDVTGKTYVEVDTYQPQFDEIGVLPPLGRWDPLKIREQGPERYRRFVEMEIKHGRLAMAAFLGVITTLSGARWPSNINLGLPRYEGGGTTFADVPGGALSSWAGLPEGVWLGIILTISALEVGPFKQDPAKEAGDVVPDGWPWARYPDGYPVFVGDLSIKEVGEDELILGRKWKLNAERNNGRAAMMGITGMMIHEALTGNPVFPLGEA